MSKTHNNRDLYKIRKFYKKKNEELRSLPLEQAFITAVKLSNTEVKNTIGAELNNPNRTDYPMQWHRRHHQHSAAHRHSAIKTRNRATRQKKHSDNFKAMCEAKKQIEEL